MWIFFPCLDFINWSLGYASFWKVSHRLGRIPNAPRNEVGHTRSLFWVFRIDCLSVPRFRKVELWIPSFSKVSHLLGIIPNAPRNDIGHTRSPFWVFALIFFPCLDFIMWSSEYPSLCKVLHLLRIIPNAPRNDVGHTRSPLWVFGFDFLSVPRFHKLELRVRVVLESFTPSRKDPKCT